jgi:hypothetical protein
LAEGEGESFVINHRKFIRRLGADDAIHVVEGVSTEIIWQFQD